MRVLMKSGYRLLTVVFLMLTGCTLGPKYKRPQVALPPYTAGLPQAAQGISRRRKVVDCFPGLRSYRN